MRSAPPREVGWRGVGVAFGVGARSERSSRTQLVAVPNVSEGRDGAALDAIGAAFARSAVLLDRHADPDHHRAVFTLAGAPGRLAQVAARRGARGASRAIDLNEPRGVHPHVGAVDVVPIVYFEPELRGAAVAEALADRGAARAGARAARFPLRRARRRADAAQSSGAGGRRRLLSASTPVSWRRTSARGAFTPQRARRSSPRGRRWLRSTSSSHRRLTS